MLSEFYRAKMYYDYWGTNFLIDFSNIVLASCLNKKCAIVYYILAIIYQACKEEQKGDFLLILGFVKAMVDLYSFKTFCNFKESMLFTKPIFLKG